MGVCTLTDGITTATLGEDVIWLDEFDWTPVPQKVRLTLDGGAVVETLSPNAATQSIKLDCGWLSKSVIDDLISLRDNNPPVVMTLTLCDTRVKSVLFSHHTGPPINTNNVVPRPDYVTQSTPDFWPTIINLFDATGI